MEKEPILNHEEELTNEARENYLKDLERAADNANAMSPTVPNYSAEDLMRNDAITDDMEFDRDRGTESSEKSS